MLEWMREKAPIVMGFVLVAFILTIFVSWGAGGVGSLGGSSIGEIDGTDISLQEFDRMYQRQREFSDSLTGPDLAQATWNNLVSQEVRTKIVDELGLEASDSAAVTFLMNNPDPQVLNMDRRTFFKLFADTATGQVDIGKYRQFIRDKKEYFEGIAKDIKLRQLPKRRIMNVVNSLMPSESELLRQYKYANEVISFDGITADPAQFDLSPDEVDPELFSSLYANFSDTAGKTPMASLAVITVKKTPDDTDKRVLYEDLSAVADDIRAGRATFADEAKAESDNSRTAQNGGFMGTLDTRDSTVLPADIMAQIRGAEAGTVLDPLYVDDEGSIGEGYHLFKIVQRRDSMVQLAHIHKKPLISPDREIALDEKTEKLLDVADSAGLGAAAQEFGFTLDTTPFFEKGGTIPGIGSVTGMGRFAFDEEPGALRDFYEGSRANYIVELIARKPAKELSKEDYRMTAFARVQDSLRTEKCSVAVREMVESLPDSVSLAQWADSSGYATFFSVDSITRNGFMQRRGVAKPVFAAFALDPDSTETAWVSESGQVYGVRTRAKETVSEIPADEKDAFMNRSRQNSVDLTYRQWVDYKKEEMKIEKNLKSYYY
ncbi:MAG: SurA N-terminal domain-containing protein [Fibrobacterota bacterium]